MRGAVALFCCSLITTLIACGGKTQTQTGATVVPCTYNGRQYPAGSTFSPDSCNTCNCTDAGEAFCTHRTCTAPVDTGAGGSLSYVDATASGGTAVELACAGDVLDVTAVDAGETNACPNIVLPVTVDAGADTSCSWNIPVPGPGLVIDPDKMRLLYLPTVGEPSEIPRAASLSGCSGDTGGWYLDNPSYPLSLRLCPCTCILMNTGRFLLKPGCRIHSIIP